MPAKIDPEANLRFLYSCFRHSNASVINYPLVAADFALKAPAARMRLMRLRAVLDAIPPAELRPSPGNGEGGSGGAAMAGSEGGIFGKDRGVGARRGEVGGKGDGNKGDGNGEGEGITKKRRRRGSGTKGRRVAAAAAAAGKGKGGKTGKGKGKKGKKGKGEEYDSDDGGDDGAYEGGAVGGAGNDSDEDDVPLAKRRRGRRGAQAVKREPGSDEGRKMKMEDGGEEVVDDWGVLPPAVVVKKEEEEGAAEDVETWYGTSAGIKEEVVHDDNQLLQLADMDVEERQQDFPVANGTLDYSWEVKQEEDTSARVKREEEQSEDVMRLRIKGESPGRADQQHDPMWPDNNNNNNNEDDDDEDMLDEILVTEAQPPAIKIEPEQEEPESDADDQVATSPSHTFNIKEESDIQRLADQDFHPSFT